MDLQDTVARLKQGLATMADEVKLQDLILRSLQELRAQYRLSSDRFSPDLIAERPPHGGCGVNQTKRTGSSQRIALILRA